MKHTCFANTIITKSATWVFHHSIIINFVMMKYFKYIFLIVGFCLFIILWSCSSEDEPEPRPPLIITLDTANFDTDTISISDLTFDPDHFSEGIWIKKYPENYTSFKFETSSGIKIITDPYNTDTVQPDIVTLSHSHSDHSDTSKLTGNYTIIKSEGTYSINGISIQGYRGNHYKGTHDSINCVYTFNIDSIKIGQFGSLGEMLTDEIGKLDVLIILVSNSAVKLSLDEIATIIHNTGAKIIIPAHGTPNLGEALASKINADYKVINSGNIVLTRKIITKIKKPLVLNLDHSF